VANTVKYSASQPIVGVNPDPSRWEGILVPFTVPELERVVSQVFQGKHRTRQVTMAKAQLNDGQTLYAVNDFFIGVNSHVSARYTIRAGGREEQHSSSGVIVSTGMGSTGWFKSLLAGALAISSDLMGRPLASELQSGLYLRSPSQE